jgi:hypothetical protein
MDVLVGPFDSVQLSRLMNNESVREPLRRFEPQHFAVFVSRQGTVVCVARSKRQLSPVKLTEIRDQNCPDAAFFVVSGRQFSVKQLQQRIGECVEAFKLPTPAQGMEKRVIKGREVLVIGPELPRGPIKRSH